MLFCAWLLALAAPIQAQWLTQNIELKAGWNAVYLHVDPSHQSLQTLVAEDPGNPIMKVWMWSPPVSTLQFVQSPQQPVESTQWMNWERTDHEGSLLQRLVPNAAYLVFVSMDTPTFTWSLKGKPIPPSYDWTTTGLNFLGFPVVPSGSPSFEDFLAKAPQLRMNAEVYQYTGGELGPSNPARIFALRNTQVRRGHAYWIRAGNVFNRYFAPFNLSLSGANGVHFRDQNNSISFRLSNLTDEALTVTLQLMNSQTPPDGEPVIHGLPPLWVRGPLNITDLTHDYTPLTGSHSWTLPPQSQPGSDIEVVLALDRGLLTGNVGDLFAGILRFTDSLGFSQINIGTSAEVGSSAGLWIGNAQVEEVRQYLVHFGETGAPPQLDEQGRYIPLSTNDLFGPVLRPYPLRLILHNPEAGSGQGARLLQQVYFGMDSWTNLVVATQESTLNPNFRDLARRLTATHLPWTRENNGWPFNGRLEGSEYEIETTVTIPFDDHASNPFLHTYHPDHDNLDSRFQTQLPQGSESFTIRRRIALRVQPPDLFELDDDLKTPGNFTQTTFQTQLLHPTLSPVATDTDVTLVVRVWRSEDGTEASDLLWSELQASVPVDSQGGITLQMGTGIAHLSEPNPSLEDVFFDPSNIAFPHVEITVQGAGPEGTNLTLERLPVMPLVQEGDGPGSTEFEGIRYVASLIVFQPGESEVDEGGLPEKADESETEERLALAARFASGQRIEGTYHEVLTLEGLNRGGTPDSRSIDLRGRFQLQRISDLPNLNTQP